MIGKKSEKANLEKKKGVFLQLGLVITLAIILVAFEWTSKPKEMSSMGATSDMNLTEEIIPITRQQEVKPPPPPAAPKVTDVLNIVEDDVKIDDELVIDDAEADQQMQVDIVEFNETEEVVEEEVFFIVEDMPSFQGKGQEGFREWIAQNLRYPEIAAENGISGKVYVQFAVNSKGEVVDAVVVRSVDPSLDKEAVRVVMSAPKWVPGKQRGKPVKVQFTFPINFVLQ
jgi:periplasmic protein TonB